MPRKRPYAPLTHPAVAAVNCPCCGALRGTPCHLTTRAPGWKFDRATYTETHTARLRAAEQRAVGQFDAPDYAHPREGAV